MTFLETYEIFFGQIMYQLKVGKFQADQMLFVGTVGQRPQGGGGGSPLSIGLVLRMKNYVFSTEGLKKSFRV